MTVSTNQVKPGAVFRFKHGVRRVTTVANSHVNWEYADGKMRVGRLSGKMWLPYFRKEAIEELPAPNIVGETRKLKPHGKEVQCRPDLTDINIKTRCPGKWVMIDLETGELWGHDGDKFVRLDAVRAVEDRREKVRAAFYALRDALGGAGSKGLGKAIKRAIDAGHEADHPPGADWWAGKKP